MNKKGLEEKLQKAHKEFDRIPKTEPPKKKTGPGNSVDNFIGAAEELAKNYEPSGTFVPKDKTPT